MTTVVYLGDGAVGEAVVYGLPFTVGVATPLPADFPFASKIIYNGTFMVVPDPEPEPDPQPEPEPEPVADEAVATDDQEYSDAELEAMTAPEPAEPEKPARKPRAG